MGNTIILHGRLTKDPEQKSYNKHDGSTGTMTVYSVACDAKFGDATYYFDCTASGRTGEVMLAHLKKGAEIIVYGEHVYREKDGKRFWNVNTDRFEFCGSKQDGDSTEQVNKDVPF